MFSTNHKTIFVLDHSPYFGISSDFPIDFDVSKSRGPGYVPLPPICKSLWTCSVEAAVEYCRIVWDLFPDGKLVQFVVSDATAHILNTWAISQQNLTHITNGLCLVAPVRRGAGGDVVGLCAAIEALGQPSPQQTENPDAERQVQNRGRIICITSARDDDSIRSLTEIALNTLMVQNKKAALVQSQPSQAEGEGAPKTEECLHIHYCHLVIINVTPEKAETLVSNQPMTEMGNSMVGDILGVEVIVSRASQLAALLGRLVLPHYELAVTTVTGIPMKEEQNASSSANYDVEIIHSLEAHAGLRAAQTAAEALESVVLRWWTPRGAEGGTGSCNGPLWRVTPSDVASRPSACLVNFLLNGRSVTLEVPRKGGGRSASHILAAQGGELWIGALGGRTPYDDPPSLSEGAGGRVTDYRIKEFGALMHQNKLLPSRGAGANLRARARLQRHTTYWPLTISSTLVFNLGPVMEPLTKLVVQETLTDEEVDTCRSVLLSLLGMESRHEFPTPSNNVRVKSSGRRDEQWRQLWGELEALIRAHSASAAHRTLLRVLLECRAKNHTDGSHVDEYVPYQDESGSDVDEYFPYQDQSGSDVDEFFPYQVQSDSDVDDYVPYQDQWSSAVDKCIQCDLDEDKFVQCDDPAYDTSSDENDEQQTSIVVAEAPPEPSISTAPTMETNDIPNNNQTDTLATEYLDEILTHIGDTPKELLVGKDIHANNAATLNDVIQNGLRQEQKDKMIIDYPIPGNCQLFRAPILNPEVKAATSEVLQMNDASLAARQGQVGVAITALANAMDILATDNSNSNQVVLKHVSNACRLLCDSHFIDTRLRQSSLISTLSNTLKDSLKESKRDKYLFGESPPDNSRATEAIDKINNNCTKTIAFIPKPIFRIKHRDPTNWRQPHRTAGSPSTHKNPMITRQQPASSRVIRPRIRILYKKQGGPRR